jgi:glycosyltransferase involved in cell wall biosynthesis
LLPVLKTPVLGSCEGLDWYVEKADYNVASFRYRCLLPAHFLESGGLSSRFFTTIQSPDGVRAAVFVKAFGDAHLELARDMYRRGRPFILDLCDNIFANGYCSKLKYLDTGNFLKMAEIAEAVVVPSEALARVLDPLLPEGRPAVVIPDPALSWRHHQTLQDWYAELQRAARLPMRGNKAGSVKAALAALRRSIEQWMKPRLVDTGARKKVIWFGKHGTRHTAGGMVSLTHVLPALEAMNRKQPLELVIISNNRRKYETHFSRLPFASRYRGWSSEAVYEELQDATAFLMPNGSDGYSACKSANRALLALANGVPVIASWLDSLAPLKDVIVLDDWAGGLERYLLHTEVRKADVARAVEVIEAGFSPTVQGRAWFNLLTMKTFGRKAAE